MKTLKLYWLFTAAIALALSSCEKSTPEPDTLSAIADLNAVAVTADSTSDDALYIINTCRHGEHRDYIAFSSLPASVGTYLTANYPGYTFKKSFKVLTKSNTDEGYVVVIAFEGKPAGLKFDATGTFVKVFEQRERRDLRGKGWRHGGRFDCRDGLHRDTIPLSALPSAIKSYFSTNYPQDTLLHAITVKEGGYVVLSANNDVFANIFKSDNSFARRVSLPAPHGKAKAVSQAELPTATKAYITATYPSFVFNKAFAATMNSTLKGYVVLIDANGTKYAMHFDANGNFVKNLAVK